MAGQVTGRQINDVLRLVASMHPNGDAQLTILGRAFVAACKSTSVDPENAIGHLRSLFAEKTDLVALVPRDKLNG